MDEARLWDEWVYGLHPNLASPYTDDEYRRILGWMEIGSANEGAIVEMGSGPSPYGMRLAREGYDIVATDISKAQLAAAHRNAKAQDIDMQFLQADVEHLPFRPGSVGTVLCGTVLHHVPFALRCVFSEFARILKEHGKMVAFEPNSHDLLEYLFYHPRNPMHYKSPNERPLCPSELKRLLSSVGFSSIRVEPKVFYSKGFFPQLHVIFRTCVWVYRRLAFILGKIDHGRAWDGNYLVVSSVK